MKNLVCCLLFLLVSNSSSADNHTAIDQAVNHPDRPAADTARDTDRKPDEVLEFFGIEPGMHVLDIFAGGGYYAEILSYVVGAEGEVVLYNNGGWDGFVGAGVEERLADNRLPNVTSVIAEANETDFVPDSFDAALFILGFHDLYYVDEGWPAIDTDAFITDMFAAIKPGGVMGIVDHAAEPGVSVQVAGILHRIDPGIIRADMAQAGFEFVDAAEFLRNLQDNRNLHMGDPSIRGRTDRVVMLFRKPD